MSPPTLAIAIGYIAAAVGSVMMLPQLVKSWRTRRVDELSLGTVLFYIVNCALWMTYGVLVHSGPVMLANAAGLAIGVCQLVIKLQFG